MTTRAASPGAPAGDGRPSAEEVAAIVAVLLVRRRGAGPVRAPARPAWRPSSYAGARSWRHPRSGRAGAA
jgi:hypothetical protein